jgi:sugar lactone lactonase YvrE
LIFLIPQQVYAIDITAIPQKINFGPDDWIRVDLSIDGYLGGPVHWTAYRPDNSTSTGSLEQFRAGKATHQIVRNAFDNHFGKWSIVYTYNGIEQTASFVVEPIKLSVKLDKKLYFDGDAMKILLSTSYYVPDATKAENYHLNFYDKKGNLAKGIKQIDVNAHQSSTTYDFLIDDLVRDNPIGQYKLKVKYYNITSEIPFEVGDIEKRTTIFVSTDRSLYRVGDSVDLILIFSKVRESEGLVEITDPSGTTAVKAFPVGSVSTKLHLEKAATMIGKYRFAIHYAGVTETGSFVVQAADITTEPDIVLKLELEKQKYRPNEMINAKIRVIGKSVGSPSFWFEDPLGNKEPKVTISMTAEVAEVTHKISRDAALGSWKMYVEYGGMIKSVTFVVEGEPVRDLDIIDTSIVESPDLLLILGIDDVKFKNPRDVAIDSENNIYVVDSGNSQIKKFDPDGQILGEWGSFGTENGQFKNPSGIFVDQKYVYVADTANARIQKFDKQGNFVYSWGGYGDEPGQFRTPVALAASASGDLFVSDSGVNKIFVFDSNGQYKDEIRSLLEAKAKFSATNYITFDSKNNFYIVSSNDNKVLQYSSIGTFIKSFGTEGSKQGQFNKPSSMAIDSDGNLYVTDTNNYRIQKFDSQGKFLVSLGTKGNESGQFIEPIGIAVDSQNNVYVVDRTNNSIQKFAPFDAPKKILIPSWIKTNAKWWSESKIQDSDFVSAIQYLIKQKIIKIPETNKVASESVKIPSWIKTNAGWWSENKISDDSFVAGIQYLVSVGIIKI